MKKTITTLVIIALVGIAANDVYRYATVQKHVNDVALSLAGWAQENTSVQTRDQAAAALVATAAEQKVEITGYDQQGSRVILTARQEVPGTIVLGAIVNLTQGIGFKEAWKTPFYAKIRRERGLNV